MKSRSSQSSPSRKSGKLDLRPSLGFIILATVAAVFAVWSAPLVPFHPDESAYIFMSSDFEAYWNKPLSLVWTTKTDIDLRMHYRMIDAPLGRLMIGLVRFISRSEALTQDWDWSRTWDENRQAGALPRPALLHVARLSITLLLPLSMYFCYLVGKRMNGELVGLLASLLLSVNMLVLLHARRAMAEGALTFGVSFTIWSLLYADRHPWLAGIGLALAINAKHSALALLPVTLLAVAWEASPAADLLWRQHLRQLIAREAQMLIVLTGVTLALNPFLWRNPLQAVQTALQRREDLLQKQVEDARLFAPEKLLETPTERSAALLINLFFAPPSFAEYGNYRTETAPAEQAYLAIPLHNLLRDLVGGSILLALTLTGILLALLQLGWVGAEQRRILALILLATACQSIGLLFFVPLAWQRYVIPLVPMVSLWAAYPWGDILYRFSRKNVTFG